MSRFLSENFRFCGFVSWASFWLCVNPAERISCCASIQLSIILAVLNLQLRTLFYVHWLSWALYWLHVPKTEHFSGCALLKLNVFLAVHHSSWLYDTQTDRSSGCTSFKLGVLRIVCHSSWAFFWLCFILKLWIFQAMHHSNKHYFCHILEQLPKSPINDKHVLHTYPQ